MGNNNKQNNNKQQKQQQQVFVREVWAENLEQEFALIKNAINEFPFVSLDTEFPGTVFQSIIHHSNPASPDQTYQLMKMNVDFLDIIQLGLTLSDSNGNLPSFRSESFYIWQFNFKDFDVDSSAQDAESIALLLRQGIDFKKNKEKGIDSSDFARCVLGSGLVLNQSCLTWITFQGTYDYGFFIKILTQCELPNDVGSFMGLMSHYFGVRVYDMKYMMEFACGFHGGLEKVAKYLGVERAVGKSHEAGSDSLLTLQTFLKFNDLLFQFNKTKPRSDSADNVRPSLK